MNLQSQQAGYYSTTDGHQLYWQRHGHLGAEPIFFLHGGPGGYCQEQHLAFFDLARFDVVLFDQRGCGRSKPQGLLTHNTTDALIQDIESLRQFFGFTQISLLGISWGSWLALKYQHHFPHRVRTCVLASVFVPVAENLATYHQTLSQIFTPLSLEHAYQVLCTGCAQAQREMTLIWCKAHLSTSMGANQLDAFVDEAAIASIRLELHYHLNHYFFSADDHTLRLAPSTTLIQGIFDPHGMQSLRWLRQRANLPRKLVRAGHNALEPTLLKTIRDTLSPI